MPLDPRILAATTLQELHTAAVAVIRELIADGKEPIDHFDEDDLPTFGGEAIHRDGGVFSWDETHVLCGDTITDACIVTRAEYLQALAEEEAD